MTYTTKHNRKFTFIDLFSGCGGMSLGFKVAGFQPVAGIEILRDPAQSYEANLQVPGFSQSVAQFITETSEFLLKGNAALNWPRSFATSLKAGIDVIIGGPPCQGYSPLGRMSRSNDKELIHKEQNNLWKDYIATVALFSPRAIVTENVPEFGKSPEFENFVSELHSLGYQTATEVLNAYEYGVPQVRKRSFTIGMKDNSPSFPPRQDYRVNVRDAIGMLTSEPDGLNWHIPRNPRPVSIERYKTVPPGGNRFDLMEARPDITPKCWLEKKTGTTDVFGRLTWDKPASTIRTEFFKPEKGRYLHPEAHRPITHREAALLQTFPSDFQFSGGKSSVARQIGEAVPPKLAEAIGRHLIHLLSR